jgi:hypothetical protein
VSQKFEHIIDLFWAMMGRESSSTLEQHCSAMRMDDNYAFTSNQLGYLMTDYKANIRRLDEEFAP